MWSEHEISAVVERVVSRLQGERAGQRDRAMGIEDAVRGALAERGSAAGPVPAEVRLPFGCGPQTFEAAPAAGAVAGAAAPPAAAFATAAAADLGSTKWRQPGASPKGEALGRGVFADIDSAVAAAREAFNHYVTLGLEARYRIVAEIRAEATRHVEAFARRGVEETGLGRYDQKLLKHRLVIEKTPGPEILEPWAKSGDDGLTLEEYAPYGVIAAITPTTNPTETILCNAIGMLAAGNAVVFNAHPGAKKVSAHCVELLNDAVLRAGGPPNLICCNAEPTIESAQQLMRHPGVRLLVVTGGPGVVKEAMASGKKVIAAGPGNPPVVVDETADLDQAADGIVKGVGLDNNIVCTAEKEIIAVNSIADFLKERMRRCGAYELSADEAARLEKVVAPDGQVNKKWVGKDAAVILREIGVAAPQGTIICFADVPEHHPFVQLELLMPVTGLVRVGSADEAIAAAVRCEHGNGHTAGMYSRHIDHLHRMARSINTSIFTKNAPTFAGLGLGGEGYCSFTIASPTGEGLTTARDFARVRRCVLRDHFRIL